MSHKQHIFFKANRLIIINITCQIHIFQTLYTHQLLFRAGLQHNFHRHIHVQHEFTLINLIRQSIIFQLLPKSLNFIIWDFLIKMFMQCFYDFRVHHLIIGNDMCGCSIFTLNQYFSIKIKIIKFIIDFCVQTEHLYKHAHAKHFQIAHQ